VNINSSPDNLHPFAQYLSQAPKKPKFQPICSISQAPKKPNFQPICSQKMKIFIVLLFSIFLGCVCAEMQLHLIEKAVDKGAVCLDGTPPGYYWRKGKQGSQQNWIIAVYGGGWCYDAADCYHRSKTALGSSKYWPKITTGSGVLSEDEAVNPDFSDWNAVHVLYCDGASLTGNRDNPLIYNDTKLWMRGKRVLDAVIDHLMSLEPSLKDAQHVLFTGCSAGALTTFLHADYVHHKLLTAAKKEKESSNFVFKAMPQSGYFLDHKNLLKQPICKSTFEVNFS